MKKLLTLMVAVALAITTVSAQTHKKSNSTTFDKGTNVGSINVGLGGSYGIPISLSYERGVYDFKNGKMSIGAGGLAGIGFSSEKAPDVKVSYTNILFGARGAWHYTAISKFDLYAGLTLGYNVASAKVTYSGNLAGYAHDAVSNSGFLFGAYAGARYFFTDRFGVNAELGYGLGYLNIGVSYKF